jgi:hypothetical protein
MGMVFKAASCSVTLGALFSGLSSVIASIGTPYIG